MPIKILINYLLGYVRITVEGYFVERFINICISKGILLWNIKRKKETLLIGNISIKDFRKIHKIANKTKCRISIQQKKGIPFLLHRYQKRKLFAILLSIMIIGIFSLTNFVWNIEIEGNKNVETKEIIEILEKEGLKLGTLKSKIHTKEIINKVRLDREDIAWMGIELKGTNAVVKIVESDKKPEMINEEDYCNISAKKAGMIVKINAINGTPLVKEGDIIKEGTPLIAGWLEGKYTGLRYVHANGEVKAKVWYSNTEKVELKQTIKERTGRSENKYSVKFNNFQINLYKTLSNFEKYDTIETSKKTKVFSDFYLPLEIIKNEIYEVQEKQVQYSKEEAKNIAIQRAKEKIESQIEVKENIVNTYINLKEEEQSIEVEVIYEVLEEIGTKEKIVF